MKFELLGICYDKTQTLRKGASKAPDMIRKTFPKLETYLNGIDLSEKAFIKDLGNIYPKTFEELLNQTKNKLKNSEFPLILGGEHTISYAAIKSLQHIKSFVCLDAHPDCENTNNHNAVVRKITGELGNENVYLYGVRCFSKKEKEYLDSSKINIIKNINQMKKIPKPIYLSIDFDVFDPSLIPATGNPEPDGLSFSDVLKTIRSLSRNISAVDFVEFTPIQSSINEIYTLLAGKFIYSVLAEIIKVRE